MLNGHRKRSSSVSQRHLANSENLFKIKYCLRALNKQNLCLPVGVLKCVERTRDAVLGGRDRGDENGPSLADEAVTQDACEFALAKGRVRIELIDASDAFF